MHQGRDDKEQEQEQINPEQPLKDNKPRPIEGSEQEQFNHR
jgi:hypothetical protein